MRHATSLPEPRDSTPSERMRNEVAHGLSQDPKQLPSKYFYDARGSRLFERITRLPEYYPTRTERALLVRWMRPWFADLRPRSLVELGAGSAEKTRILLDAMLEVGSGELYVPVDVSADFLADTARRLRTDYPDLHVSPAVADIAQPIELSVDPAPPTVYAFLGGTIGNFEAGAAADLLRHVRESMQPPDRFLLGADLRPGPGKGREEIEAAYDDDAGVTAEFNLNMLRALNRELGTDFDVAGFRHRAFYDDVRHRIEMHLVADTAQIVHLPEVGTFRLAAGESIRTEISCKYDRASLQDLFRRAGLVLDWWRQDDLGRFALAAGVPG